VKRFPVGLTLAAAFGLALLVGLGVWQMKRLVWKDDLLARIAALQTARPRPIGEVLAAAARGADVGYVRVTATCGPPPATGPAVYRYALRDGRVGWRLMSFCPLAGRRPRPGAGDAPHRPDGAGGGDLSVARPGDWCAARARPA